VEFALLAKAFVLGVVEGLTEFLPISSTGHLILVGELDQPDILRTADRLAEGIPHARKAVISGTAHAPSMERPDEFNRLVLDFLQAA